MLLAAAAAVAVRLDAVATQAVLNKSLTGVQITSLVEQAPEGNQSIMQEIFSLIFGQ